jgi:hypothetical protein
MAFDDKTRGQLQKLVTTCRGLLTDEFRIQVQQTYGLDPNTGDVTPLERLTHLSAAERETADLLRQTLAHYLASEGLADSASQRVPVIDRIVREQAFTVLNRLAALLMMEARGVLQRPAVGSGQQSPAFELYKMVAGSALGDTGQAYQTFLFSLFDEFAQELPALFDRFAPQGRLFPREAALLQVLAELNHHEIQPLWSEDETIGWIYQYFNSKEERKAMRDASQAPRNSRELAVRNQFFTPRYVVEFLVDNTLGRLWFNATGGQTSLRERCQYLLVKPDEQPAAALRLRDPRTLKLLDPACGSMHFGLYAFDLFLAVYREAWDWEQTHGAGSLDVSTQPDAGLQPLCQSYPDQAAYLRDVPRLVIEHNIHGVDIDPRAAQIASLALWLRAQRAWHDDSVKAKDRPAVGRGHVIAATAPPAEKALREQFAAQLDGLDAELFTQTLKMLKGVPELGVLLQVERELPRLVRTVFGEHGSLFKEADVEQWRKAEDRLRAALSTFAQAAKSTYQGRLFAQDALQGLRLIDLCREVFDVVVMNPPFGQPTAYAQGYLKELDSDGWKDVYAGFFESAIRFSLPSGYVGAITSSQYFHTRQMARLREDFVRHGRPRILLDLGDGVLDDAAVQTAIAILGGPRSDSSMLYEDLTAIDDKGEYILDRKATGRISELTLRDLDFIPGRPFCLHASSPILRQWRLDTTLDPNTAVVATGNHTFDDERFLRLRHEVFEAGGSKSGDWVTYEKGGEFQPFQSSTSLVLNWSKDGAELRAVNVAAYGSDAQVMQSSKYWRKFGLCYNHVGLAFSPRALPAGTVFSSESIAILIKDQEDIDPIEANLMLLGFLASTAAQELVSVFGRYRKIENRAVSGIPISFRRLQPHKDALVEIARRGIDLCLNLESMDETSPHFRLPEELASGRQGSYSRQQIADELVPLYERLDRICDSILQVDDADLTARRRVDLIPQFSSFREIVSEKDRRFDTLMWAVGVAFGRFDWRLALSDVHVVPVPGPFEALPSRSPGMLASDVDPYHTNGGVLVDDSGHPHDLARLVEEVLATVDAAVPGDLRRWLQKDFFPFHLQRYSKSRRKAPIYWPLSTPSGSYTLWIYYPSVSSQTLYTAINDFVEPKLMQVGHDVATLRNKGSGRTRDEEKEFEALQGLEAELLELRDKLQEIALGYKPKHDDGVQIAAAPLWPLFRHKPWQKVLRDTWGNLEKGDYDWSHLAMAYWPDRVREKCKTDKSLAIAHGLEDLYVEPEAAPKKTRGRKKADT